MSDRQPPSRPAPYDVLIAGAGPVGLFLACELRLGGASVLVLEQAADPASPAKRLPFGLRGLSTPSVEAFHRRGLLEAMAAPEAQAGPNVHWMQGSRRPGGHFAGIPFFHDRVDAAQWPHRLPGSAGPGMAVTLERLETVLAARAVDLGVEIRRGCGVAAVEASEDGVTVGAGGELVRGRWLVGCDGGRSAVRKLCGFPFVGTDAELTGYGIEATLAEPHGLEPGRHHTPTGMYTFAAPGTITVVDFDGGAFHRSAPVTLAHAQAVLRRIAGVPVTLTALRSATTWTDRARQATAYRRGRVLLAGDAAHTHSPLGGQGLNLGLGDAMNLGWKLAATLRGEAPDGLLDTYGRERHPVGAEILDWSRAQIALMRPTPGTRALAAVLRDLVATRDGATYVAGRVWGVSLGYDLGGSHPLVGRSAPDVALHDGTRLGQHLRDGRGLLLDFDARAPFRALAGRYGARLAYRACAAEDRLGLGALMLRPDGIVAWACDADPRPEEAAAAASRWFGPPGRDAA